MMKQASKKETPATSNPSQSQASQPKSSPAKKPTPKSGSKGKKGQKENNVVRGNSNPIQINFDQEEGQDPYAPKLMVI